MEEIIFAFMSVGLIFLDVRFIRTLSECINLIILKNQLWVRCFLKLLGIFIFETVLFSWLPGRIGAVMTLSDGAIVLEDGAIIRNAGYIIFSYVVLIGLKILKNIWRVIRKKEKFNKKLFLLDILSCIVLCFVAGPLIENEYVMHFEGGETLAVIVAFILFVMGVRYLILQFKEDWNENKDKENTERSGGSDSTKNPSKDPLARYDEIIAEKDKLAIKGDYASQIPLLIEAVGLDVDVTHKSRAWNFLGAAYQNIGSGTKSEECFQKAKRIDPEHPSSYINLAMCYAGRKEYTAALRNADIAITKAKSRNFPLGKYYARYALIAGLGGDKERAKTFLKLA